MSKPTVDPAAVSRHGSYNPKLHGNTFKVYPDGTTVRLMPCRKVRGAVTWLMQSHATHNLPLSLGIVGRW